MFLEILFDVLDEEPYRRGDGHGVFADEMDRPIDRAAVFVTQHFTVYGGIALRQKVRGNDGVAEAAVYDLYAGEAVVYGKEKMGRIADVLPPPPGTELVQRRIGTVADRRLAGERFR